jgi:hypothetical protein
VVGHIELPSTRSNGLEGISPYVSILKTLGEMKRGRL